MPCPDENTVAELFDGLLAARQRQLIEDHIDTCPRCRSVLAALSGAITDPQADAPVQRPTDSGSASVVSAPGLLRGDTVGRYAVLECLGAGSMGVVYAAYDPDLDRKVALKLLRSAIDGNERDRPFREAKSMARLTHQNIVGVHDVGLHGEHVFIAMEYVDGTTLTQWLAVPGRSAAAILEVFVAAGQGLAAAHEAGVVHRDFKPDNVMVASDARVCVADFGLAAVRATVSGVLADASGGRDGLAATSVVGTPRYMAPEQSEGAPAEPASDQFSYCVALYEALYRQFPFPGDTPEELAKAKAEGRLRAPPATATSVAGPVRRAIERGLLANPADRHANMRALLDALRGRKESRAWGWAMLGGGAVGAVFVGLALTDEPLPACPPVGVDAAWDGTRRHAVALRIASDAAPYAEQVSRGVVENLDRYAEAWGAMHQEACEAARVRKTQSSEVMELRMECLEARRVELAALSDVLRGESVAAGKAIDATARLTPVQQCRDVERLRRRHASRVGQPDAPPETVSALARIKALVDAGDFSAAAPLATSTAQAAQATGDAHSAAQALIALSWAQAHLDPGATPEETLHRALDLAETAGADEQRARAMTLLVFVVGYAQARYDEGARWGQHAAALNERIDASPRERAQLHRYRGLVRHEEGRFSEAEAFHRRAIDTLTSADLDRHPDFGKCITALANTLLSRRHFAEAQTYFERGLALELQALGPWHPRVANATHGLGNVLEVQGQHEAAREHYRRALQVHEAVYGRVHTEVAGDLLALGHAAYSLGDTQEAERALSEALTIHDAVVDGPHPRRASIMSSFARLRSTQGDTEASREFAEQAVALQRQAAPKHPDVAVFEHNLGVTLLELSRADEALTHFQRSVDAARAALGPEHAMVGVGLTGLGRAQYALQQYTEATESFVAALQLWETAPTKPEHRFDARFNQARALWDSGRELDRARRLARLAVDEYADDEDPDRQRLADARAWIASRP